VTSDEARGLLADSEQPPVVKWISKRGGWRFARLVSAGRVWAQVETGGGDFPSHKERVKLEVLEHYAKRERERS